MTTPYDFSAGGFTATPLSLNASTPEEQAHLTWKMEVILGRAAAHRSFFTDQLRGCDLECNGFCQDLHPACTTLKQIIASRVLATDAITWEVHAADDPLAFVGILRLSRIVLGCDALAHYLFFDQRLKNKTPLLQAWKAWAFSDHGSIGWQALNRVSIEVPSTAHGLARHAQKHLGFGGPFHYRASPEGPTLMIEGLKEEGLKQEGGWVDLISMGCMSGV